MRVRLDICSLTGSIELDLPGTAAELWDKAMKTGHDDDWTEFADYVSDDVAEQLEFNIEDGEEITP